MKFAEYYLLAISMTLLVSYHLYLFWMIRHHPLRTDIGINRCARSAWVRHIMQRPPGDVLAVQTLRNALMSASFLASTAILLVAGLLSFILTNKNSLDNFNHVLDMLSSQHPRVVLSRFLLLIMTFFFAFFNFALTVRYYNHTAFMLNAASSMKEDGHSLPEQFIINALQRGALHFTLGMRAFLMILPFGMWLMGPSWLLLGSVLLVTVMWKIDFPAYTGIPRNECFVGKQHCNLPDEA
ncbi:MAG: DUF599 domain-containing protein [Thiothrix sp.]